ncbi:GIP, partial [Symbiodinium pilosum]
GCAMNGADERGLKRFNGEDDDAGKQLRKWKLWAQAKMATMKDFAAKQQGPWIYTLLDGKALEAVEHLTLEDMTKDSGAETIWKLLDLRFLERASEDQMGEALGEVFGLCAREGESMQQWAARAQEVFQKCRRKAEVEFPTAAQGWIALNCAGLSEEQKAIVKAKTQGKLELPTVTSALRSCFPQYRAGAKAKKPVATLLVDDENIDEVSEDGDPEAFADVEAFLADNNLDDHVGDDELQEQDAAEALAVSWKERRCARLAWYSGYGVVDSGCGRTLIGQETLLALTQKLATRTKLVPVEYHSDSSFRFGNGATEESNRAVRIPVGVGRKVGTIDAAIISGRAPLLLGRPTLEKMNMVLDFGGRKMRFLVQDAPIPMHTNSAGQLLIDVLDFPVSKAGASSKDKLSEEACRHGASGVAFDIKQGSDLCQHAAKYTPQFVRAMWTCLVPREPQNPEPERPDAETRKVDAALRKLHCNLGHPSHKDLTRILKHSKASELALSRVQHLECSACANNQRPTPALPANTTRVCQFNEKLGLDVKYLPRWNPGQKVACVNLVDYASSFQVMVPIGRRETGELLRQALLDKWLAWAGPPQALRLDPARPNLGNMLSDFCNNHGIAVEQTPAEAHWQLGKVERHGQWSQRILSRVLDEVKPANESEWVTCLVQAQSAKNTLISESGASPYQFVFGRNPRVPSDLLQESPDIAASDAVLADDAMQQANAVRQSARRAVLEVQDDRALRAALRARPRVARPFSSGDWVYYWRTQKSVEGTRIEGGRWYGAALVLGHIGKNIVVAHKLSIMRCAPEQLRHATAEEQAVATFPHNDLLGIKNLLERGQSPKSQFEDLVPQPHPPALDEGAELPPSTSE